MAFDLLVVLLLIAANGVFAGAEIAVLSLRKTRLQELVEARAPGARAVAWLRSEPERFLATVQVGITLVGTTAAAFGGERLAHVVGAQLGRLPLVGPWASRVGLAVVVLGISVLGIVLGELVPKSLALRSSERYATALGPLLRAMATLFRPAVWALTRASNLVLALFDDRTSFTESRLSPEELRELLEEAGRTGSLDARTSEIASRALEFRELTAADVMVAARDIVRVPVDATPADVAAALARRRYARLPVYDGHPDDVVGYVSVKDFFVRAAEGERITVAASLRPMKFVPRAVLAGDLLRQMQSERRPQAMVVEEGGAIVGLVSIEDLLEELVGEILSEGDPAPTALALDAEGSVVLPGHTPLRDINRALDTALPEPGEYTTLAGLCVYLAGRIPTVGQTFSVPDGTTLRVTEASPRRVRSVRVTPPSAEAREAGRPSAP